MEGDQVIYHPAGSIAPKHHNHFPNNLHIQLHRCVQRIGKGVDSMRCVAIVPPTSATGTASVLAYCPAAAIPLGSVQLAGEFQT